MDNDRVDEMGKSIFQEDQLLGFEYLETRRGSRNISPEQSLILAVLKDALTAYKENMNAESNKKKAKFRDAETWLFNNDNEAYARLSFGYICEVLNLDPDYIRNVLKHWRNIDRKEAAAQSNHHALIQWHQNPKARKKSRIGKRRDVDIRTRKRNFSRPRQPTIPEGLTTN